MRKPAPALFAFAVALAVPALALASTKTIHDAKGDVKAGHVDIASVTAVTSSTSVTWTIVAYGNFTTPKAPCLSINPGANKQPPGNEFEVCGSGVIHNFKHGGTSGTAKVTRPDQSSITYVIRSHKFGSAKAISWNAGFDFEFAKGAADCKQNPDNCDRAPQPPGRFVVQSL